LGANGEFTKRARLQTRPKLGYKQRQHPERTLDKQGNIIPYAFAIVPYPPRLSLLVLPLFNSLRAVFSTLWGSKRDAYLKTGRWRMQPGPNSSPMLLLRKPDPPTAPPRIRTVFDLRERNANSVKMASQLLDIETILTRVTRSGP
jgi:hypothetical protein